MEMMYELNYLTFTDLTVCFFLFNSDLQGLIADGESWRVFGNTHPRPC